jgi:hypothetical protein
MGGYGRFLKDLCEVVHTRFLLFRTQIIKCNHFRTFLTFGDIADTLHMLRIECARCARKGSYSVSEAIARNGTLLTCTSAAT